ncbi:MAG: phosphatidate cytidylyltransferase [Anaerolineae bacterium]
MLRRTVTAILLLLLGLPAVLLGGRLYFLLIAIFLVGAAWEYVLMFRKIGYEANLLLTLGGVLAILAARAFWAAAAVPTLAGLILLTMTIHLFAFERGRDRAALDFAVTLGGLIYLGWIGAYLIDLRSLPAGGWWLMLILPAVWLADSGAYSIGAAYGKHKLSPRLSPGKTWEGYWAGVFTGALSGAFLAFAYATWGSLNGHITPLQGAILGLILAAITPLGDLGESMFKRQAHLKDSGNIFPGHGGFFDRIDSWLWAAVIGYYFVQWFILGKGG